MSKDPANQETTNTTDTEVLEASRRLTRRSFAIAAMGAVAGFGLYRWVDRGRDMGGQPLLRRRALQFNAALSRKVFDDRALAPTYPTSQAGKLRINGLIGIKKAILPESWRLQVVGVENERSFPQYVPDVTSWVYEYSKGEESTEGDHFTYVPPEPVLDRTNPIPERGGKSSRTQRESERSYSALQTSTPGLLLEMKDLLRLSAHDLVTEFKCVEGWSQVTHWRGIRMSDFLAAYPPARMADGSLPRYVYMETPNSEYYVGYDLNVCRHPQTLLVTEMSGEPLTQLHGAPLRLHTPTKYGYKQIKRIGLIAYTNAKPDDFWTKLGYDWYAGL